MSGAALVQTFHVNNLNQLTNATCGGTLTVAGVAYPNAVRVSVQDNANPPETATLYADGTFAREGVSLLNGQNTFWAIGEDNHGRLNTNPVTANLPASVNLQYDARGNLTHDGQRVFYYDEENQLTAVLVSNAWKSEFAYDGLMRRRMRKEYAWQNSAWLLTNEVRYVYDGRLVVQERDGENLPLVTYTRGNDLSGARQGAGGIGGLLARTDHRANSVLAHGLYQADGNGNVTALISTNGFLLARYHYDPYGNTLAADGPLAEANLYRFSSKEHHPLSGLYYYGFRYYEPNFQRWVNPDPLGDLAGLPLMTALIAPSVESGGDGEMSAEEFHDVSIDLNRNLYAAIGNAPMNRFDAFGLICLVPPDLLFPKRTPEQEEEFKRKHPTLTKINEFLNMGLSTPGTFGGLGGLKAPRLPKPVVIGENMKERVIPYAEQIGADYYKPRSPNPANWLKNNLRWLSNVMRQQRQVIDIGPDPLRATRSIYWQRETELLREAQYSRYRRCYTE